jgi:hypothetical protein
MQQYISGGKTAKVIFLTQEINKILIELQSLADDHFQISPECIKKQQVEDLYMIYLRLSRVLHKAKAIRELE